MNKWLDLLYTFLNGLVHQSKRAVGLKALVLALKAIKSFRRLVLIYYFSLIAVMLSAAGLFILSLQLLYQFQTTRSLYFDAPVVIGLTLFLGSFLFTFWSLRENRWLKSFYIHEAMQLLQKSIVEPKAQKPLSEEVGIINDQELKAKVDAMVEAKLKAILEQAEKATDQEATKKTTSPTDTKVQSFPSQELDNQTEKKVI